MACFNTNTPEYKALLARYKTDIVVDAHILEYQEITSSDIIPTLDQIDQVKEDIKVSYSLRKQDYTNALISNLARQKLITKNYRGKRYVNATMINGVKQSDIADRNIIRQNKQKILNYLELHGLPTDLISFDVTNKSETVTFNPNILNPVDLIPEKFESFTLPVVEHLQRMFPQVEIAVTNEAEAKEYYDNLEPGQKRPNVKFEDIKSYYVDGVAYLIEGRVDNETAIEEILHPFVDSVFVDNNDLFNSLLSEARANFPVLTQQIEDTYGSVNVPDKERDLELVTQALTRHFAKEYEQTPTKSFLDRVVDFLKWFGNFINSLADFTNSGTEPIVKTQDIKSNLTLSQLAQAINTSDLRFELKSKANGRVRYSLSKQHVQAFNKQRHEMTESQKFVVDSLINRARATEREFDQEIPAGAIDNNKPLVVKRLDAHEYIDINDPEKKYLSTTKAIYGEMSTEEELDVKTNLVVGQDFDSVVNGIIIHKTGDQIFAELQNSESSLLKLNRENFDKIYNSLFDRINGIREGSNAVLIPQVVVYSEVSNLEGGQGIAGTIDILAVLPNGKIRIIDLKTSKRRYGSKEKEMYHNTKHEIEGKNSLLVKKMGKQNLSTKAKHGLQMALYRRMLENMGYTVEEGPLSTQVMHVFVEMTGTKRNQKWTGKFENDNTTKMNPSFMQTEVDILVPRIIDEQVKQRIEEINVETGEAAFDNVAYDYDDPGSVEFDETRYKAINKNLRRFMSSLRDRKRQIEDYKKELYVDMDNVQAIKYTNNLIATLNLALSDIEADAVQVQSNAWYEMLKVAIREIDKFQAYVNDPKNYNDPNFITYLRNYDQFAKSYIGLKSIANSGILNKGELALLQTLETKLIQTRGDEVTGGLINAALLKWGENYVKENSNRDFTEEEIKDLIKEVRDIGILNYATRDLATSPDTMLALVAKEYSRARLRGQLRAEEQSAKTRTLANRLVRLTGSNDMKEVYRFMAEMDDADNFTGRYIRETADWYFAELDQIQLDLKHENGDPKEYREFEDLTTADPADIEYNIRLYKLKQKRAEFFRAETIDPETGELVDGKYHFYTQEFKDIRNQFEEFIPAGKHGYWIQKTDGSVSNQEYAEYKEKYFDSRSDSVRMQGARVGQPTGLVQTGMVSSWPKQKYRKIRQTSSEGRDMRSEKFRDMMEDTSDLGQARREFYKHFREEYDRQLMKLPASVRNQMQGQAPIIRARMVNDARRRGIIGPWLREFGQNLKEVFSTTVQFRRVMTDKDGQMVDSIPIMFVGRARTQEQVNAVEKEISDLDAKRLAGQVSGAVYKKKMSELKAKRAGIMAKPDASEISMDFGDSLIKFTSMSSMYEAMDNIEDTLQGIKEIVDQRVYDEPSDTGIVRIARNIKDSAYKLVGKAGSKSRETSNIEAKLAGWFKATFYNTDEMTKNTFEKVKDFAIQYSSLSYVAFNAIGNFNNLAIASANNSIEALGERFYSRKNYMRANAEFYGRQIGLSMMKRLGYANKRISGDVDRYDPRLAMNKWEAVVLYWQMMDAYADIRENIQNVGALDDKIFTLENLKAFGYSLQDSAEYKVQTTVGVAMLMDQIVENSSTGESMSLWDAMEYDPKTQQANIKEGFDTLLETLADGSITRKELTENARFDLRMKIRETNKQIHGNYAREDRTMLQRHALGQLVFQFKKWLAPAIRARWQGEYFDENLGWMEGRYISFFRFMGYLFKKMAQTEFQAMNWRTYTKEQYGREGIGVQEKQRIQNQLFGIKRTLADLSMITAAMISNILLRAAFEGEDDDDTPGLNRLRNLLLYQSDRTHAELSMYLPVVPDATTGGGVGLSFEGLRTADDFASNPIASLNNVRAMAKAIGSSMYLGKEYLKKGPGLDGSWGLTRREWAELYADKDIAFQYKPRKGKLKAKRDLFKAIPLLYSIERYLGFDTQQDFYID